MFSFKPQYPLAKSSIRSQQPRMLGSMDCRLMHAPQVKSMKTKLIEDLRGTTFKMDVGTSKLATETVAFSSKLTGQSPGLRTQVATCAKRYSFPGEICL